MDKRLLEILVCPANKTRLIYDAQKQYLVSVSAGLAYPIRDGIPILLADEASKLTHDEVTHYRKQQANEQASAR
jgi:uncharacterized protein YbaR (Trm112 family)